MKNITDNIKELRLAKNLTQSELAERIGITKATISAYENGTRFPSYDVLLKIARLFNVTVDYLLGNSLGKDYINVSALDSEQRNLIENLIAHFSFHNYLLAHSPGTVRSYKDAMLITDDVLSKMAKHILDNQED